MPYAIRSSQYKAVTNTTGKFTNAMKPGFTYRFTASTNCWVLVGATGASATADTADNHLYITGQTLFLANPDQTGTTNSFVHVIRDTADGDATLSLVAPV